MSDKKTLFRMWLKEKLKDKPFRYLCYASHSFGKQRNAMHNLMLFTKNKMPEAFRQLPFLRYIVCGWADDITGIMGKCFPDFMEKFGTGISIKEIEEIIWSEIVDSE